MALVSELDLLYALDEMPFSELLDAGRQLFCSFNLAVQSPRWVYPGELHDLVVSGDLSSVIGQNHIERKSIAKADIGFVWVTTVSFSNNDDAIPILAIDVNADCRNRSQDAYFSHECLCGVFNRRLIVLARGSNGFCFTMTELRNNTRHILLSDWYTYDESGLRMFERSDPYSLRINSTAAFYNDFISIFAREYYRCPEWITTLSLRLLEEKINEYGFNNVDNDTLHELQDEAKQTARQYYLLTYGDDYIECDKFDSSSEEGLPDIDIDIDFDLLEEELSEAISNIDYEEEDDDSIFDDSSSEGNISVNIIPERILRDPILLVNWFEEH